MHVPAKAKTKKKGITTGTRGENSGQLKQNQAVVFASGEIFQMLLKNSAEGISLLGPDGKFVYASPSTLRIMGYSLEEMREHTPIDNIHPHDQTALLNIISKAMQDPEKIYSAQYRARHKDGSWRWIDTTIQNLLANPDVQAILFNYRDVTERKLGEIDLELAHDRLRNLNAILSAASQAGTRLRDILEAILDTTLDAFGLEMGMIWTETGEMIARGVPPEFGPLIAQTIRANELIVSGPVTTRDWQETPANSPTAPIAAVLAQFGIRADLVTPLLENDRRIGGLSIMSAQPRAWAGGDIDLLESIGRHLGILAERARLFEETHSRMAELEAVNRVSTALRTVQTLDEMLPLLLEETLAVLHADQGSIWLYDDTLHQVRPMVTLGWDLASRAALTPEISGQEIAEHVFASGQIHVSSDFYTDPDLSDATRQRVSQDSAGAVVPVRAASQVIGVLFVNLQKPRQLTPGEISLLSTLSEIAGNAIQRMRLHAQTQKQLQQLQALREIDVAISGSFDQHLTLDILLDQVMKQLRVDAATVLLLDTRTQTLDYAAGRGFNTALIQQVHVRLGEGLAGKVALARSPAGLMDCSQGRLDLVHASILEAILSAEQFEAFYAIPLIVKGLVKGVLEIYQRAPHSPTPEWFEFLETLGGQAAIAIENKQLFESLQSSNSELAQAYDATIEGWSRALDLRDNETEGHTQRVTAMSLRLAQVMGYSGDELTYIRWGALLHDIGKMGVPDRVLFKPGPLTDEEWVLMRAHTTNAYEMLSPIAYLRTAIDIPYCHHEKWDGSGYPRGLKGTQIPLTARIFAPVDVWDALRSDRPYRAAWPEERVRAYIQEQSGSHFDPQIAELFLEQSWNKIEAHLSTQRVEIL